MRERDGTWDDPWCFEKDKTGCRGVMELKDVTLTKGSFEMFSEEGQTFPIHKDPILEKTWECDTCGFVFYE